jgi:hypothetical protein
MEVGMMGQGVQHRKVGEVFGLDHTIIIRAWTRFQQHGTWLWQNKDDY